MSRPPRPRGVVTRGTTGPQRLRAIDGWLAARCARLLADAADPLVVDLGYGGSPVTTVELRARLAAVRPDVRVVGLEIDPARVAEAAHAADPPGLEFRRGGFELAGLRPVLVRAANVLRQYPESAVAGAWAAVSAAQAPGGLLVEGTCDELGRYATWVAVVGGRPASLTLAVRLRHLDRPATLAERLPKALIHHNVPGQGVHRLLSTLDDAWRVAAPYAAFGPRQRWRQAVAALAGSVPLLSRAAEHRRGVVTVPWSVVDPSPRD
ncbi:hypothetical protein GCM10010124_23110 [Pilimelia terevasa]|uniref:Class I SAM-dependent methyltransferase n=1 Tax=Pilimelia terevasa TaxID=53372 RepID=A0A8J3FJM6_9ACTN|nr:class I SAM-dependent methyltransferase [Pilimelia terevasa]GGK29786.1 hypothetical protein GCM10010124_23110 [Pilimelia terevasa]